MSKTGVECTGCATGVKMCHNRPCLGTPAELEAIIDAGFAEKLRVDFWAGAPPGTRITLEDLEDKKNPFHDLMKVIYNYQQLHPNPIPHDVEWICGGTMKDLNYKTNFSPSGTCNFLTPDEKCELHDLGLKPEQGRMSCCDDKKDLAGNDNIPYAHMWDTEEGRRVVEKFKKIVGI